MSLEPSDNQNIDLESLLTLDGLGIDVSFLKEMGNVLTLI